MGFCVLSNISPQHWQQMDGSPSYCNYVHVVLCLSDGVPTLSQFLEFLEFSDLAWYIKSIIYN